MNDDPVYVKINRKIWNTAQLRNLSRDSRELYLYLITCPHGNMLGLFILRPGYALEDLQLGPNRDRFFKPFRELLTTNLFKYDESTEMLYDVEQFIKHPPPNQNTVESCIKIINSLPKTILFQDLMQSAQSLGKQLLNPLIQRLAERSNATVTVTVTEAVTVTVTVTEGIVSEVISYLNFKTGKNFSPKNKDTLLHMTARIKEGRTVEDFKKVIDVKCSKWLRDGRMRDYLRPSTLFGSKFESYLNETTHALQGIVSDKSIKNIETLDNWEPENEKYVQI